MNGFYDIYRYLRDYKTNIADNEEIKSKKTSVELCSNM